MQPLFSEFAYCGTAAACGPAPLNEPLLHAQPAAQASKGRAWARDLGRCGIGVRPSIAKRWPACRMALPCGYASDNEDKVNDIPAVDSGWAWKSPVSCHDFNWT